MKHEEKHIFEKIQQLVARTIAIGPAGEGLCLIGGFRYRLLDDSPRISVDIDYHWEKELEKKQMEIVSLLRRKLLPEVKQRLGYDGRVDPATGPDADIPSTRIVHLSFHRPDVLYSRIEIQVDITRIECLDTPIVRTQKGTVYLTASDQDMIESKVISLFNRMYIQERDIMDIFLFEDQLISDSATRIARKLARSSIDQSVVSNRLNKMINHRNYHIRNIEAIIDEQIDPEVADRIRETGGGVMVFDHVLKVLQDKVKLAPETQS